MANAMVLAERLAHYAHQLDYDTLPDAVVDCVKKRFLDSLACALGAYGAIPINAVTVLAAAVPVPLATVFGTTLRTTPDIAAFANGSMVRYLDYNDGYMSKEPGHPSDNIPACLAVAEAEGATGGDLIAAIVVAYEIQMRLQDAAGMSTRGWDHANYILVSMAAAASRLMKLDVAQTTHAINLALNGHIAMRQVRSGELSAWKGCSAANAARNAIFSAQLARYGMTGPSPIFEGKMGFANQVSGKLDVDVDQFGTADNGDFCVLKSKTKIYPTNGELQTAVIAALALRSRIADIERIASVHIETTEIAYRITATDPEKWRPATRETADHSLPYNVARMLLDGELTVASFAPHMLSDGRVIRLMDRTTVAEDPALTALFPKNLPNRVTVTLDSGDVFTEEVITRAGTPENPMTDADFEVKFRSMAEPHLAIEAQNVVMGFVKTLDRGADFKPLFDAMVPARAA